MTRYGAIVYFASALHIVWGGLLLFSADPIGTTAIYGLVVSLGGQHIAALLLLGTAALALAAVRIGRARWPLGLLFSLPQQVLLIISAGYAIQAMVLGHFADGVERPHAFIIADKASIVLLAALHSLALVETFGRKEEASWKESLGSPGPSLPAR
jgi:hypothetical protein